MLLISYTLLSLEHESIAHLAGETFSDSGTVSGVGNVRTGEALQAGRWSKYITLEQERHFRPDAGANISR